MVLEEDIASSKVPAGEFNSSDLEVGGVVVYRDRAEVKRLIRVSVKKGENDVVVNQLPSVVDPKSLRVEGEGDAIITDVIYQSKTNYDEKTKGDKKQYDKLQDEIKELVEKEKFLTFKLEVINKQRTILNKFAEQICKFSDSSKEEKADMSEILKSGSVDGVMGFLTAYQDKMSHLDEQWRVYDREKSTLTEQLNVLRKNAQDLNPTTVKDAKTNRCVCISLEAASDTDVVLALSYVVSNASWTPQYDLRVFSNDKTMKVLYYGLIKQSTGEDWLDAKLSLSTANPSIGGSVPELDVQLLKFKQPVTIMPKRNMRRGYNERSKNTSYMTTIGFEDIGLECLAMDDDGGGEDALRGLAQPVEITTTQVETNWTSVAFNIPRMATIPSDNTEHKVTVALVDLKPEFEYAIIPRMSSHTYLQAVVKNTSSYALLSGPANVFLDNNFVAKSSLKDVSPSEEFHCSLGVDPSIRLTTIPVKVLRGQSGLISKSVTVGYRHMFEVKNTKQEQVKVTLSEQLPLSTDERIKVHLNDPDVRKVNTPVNLPFGTVTLNSSNNLDWVVNIPTNTTQPITLTYSVEYPPGHVVQGLPKN
ncbi:protein F37C4.5-like [Dysidea avara]|uniref:protein F37C4.5-like n=1 Tax=Dysidea avara TaxID=196820 RepID=UPI003322B5C8